MTQLTASIRLFGLPATHGGTPLGIAWRGRALVAATTGLLPVQIAFVGAAVAMVTSGQLSLREAYESIDWPIIILLGAMIPVGASADPFLMAVAIGASRAFLTPIGHQSNTLVMGPGGYRFGDYWRMGLPLEVIIAVVSIPLLLWFWPLGLGTP